MEKIADLAVVQMTIIDTLHKEGNAVYTPQDNRADFGPISPHPTILGNVPIIF